MDEKQDQVAGENESPQTEEIQVKRQPEPSGCVFFLMLLAIVAILAGLIFLPECS